MSALGISLLLPTRVKPARFALGASLHMGIGLMLGLWTFSIIMVGASLILLSPMGASVIRRESLEDPSSGEQPGAPEEMSEHDEPVNREGSLDGVP